MRRRGEVSRNGRGIEPPTLFTTMSMRPKASLAALGQAGDGVEVAQVGRHDDGLAADGLDLRGHRVELLLGRARRCRTSAPASASAMAEAAPMPRPAPVTTATLSSSRNRSWIIRASHGIGPRGTP